MTPVSVNAAAGIGRITLDRPEQMNAVNVELGVELERAILTLGSDPTVQRDRHSGRRWKLLRRWRFRRGRATAR